MKKKHKVIIIVIAILILIYAYKNYFLMGMIVGTYISNNRESILEGPHFGDTLVLFENNRFESDTWGSGTYELKYSGMGTQICLNYNYELGKAGYQTHFFRFFLGKPKISLDSDLGYYFEKIK